MTNIQDKIKYFNYLCGEWDYRNVDMTESHLSDIEIQKNCIKLSCEKYSTIVDEYVFSPGGIVKNKQIIRDFINLDMDNREQVLDFMKTLNGFINWHKVDKNLSKEEQKLIKKYELSDKLEEELEQDF